MLLSLKVIKYKAGKPDQPMSVDFDRQGGGIGRLPAPVNRFHLPDPEKYISRKHAHIRFENGTFFLTDTSTAGTFFINKNRSVHNETVPLADGDVLRIGDYEFKVSLTNTGDGLAASAPNLDEENGPSFFDSGFEPPATTDWSDDTPSSKETFTWSERHPFEGPIESESFTPPEVGAPHASREIPADFDINQLLENKEKTHPPTPLSDNRNPRFDDSAPPTEKRQPPPLPPASEKDTAFNQPAASSARLHKAIRKRPQPRAEPSQEEMQPLLDIFLAAAGLEADEIKNRESAEDIFRTLGALFKELTGGLMTTLQARTELKSQFRVSMTVIQPVENNPLKFSARAEDALKQLLRTDDAAFLDPIDAVREGFDDIGNHQLALAAGIQSAMMSLLKKFDPEHFQKRFDRGLAIQRKAKSWDAYQEAYNDLVKDALDDIFGAEFSRAYDRQIQKLRSERKKPS